MSGYSQKSYVADRINEALRNAGLDPGKFASLKQLMVSIMKVATDNRTMDPMLDLLGEVITTTCAGEVGEDRKRRSVPPWHHPTLQLIAPFFCIQAKSEFVDTWALTAMLRDAAEDELQAREYYEVRQGLTDPWPILLKLLDEAKMAGMPWSDLRPYLVEMASISERIGAAVEASYSRKLSTSSEINGAKYQAEAIIINTSRALERICDIANEESMVLPEECDGKELETRRAAKVISEALREIEGLTFSDIHEAYAAFNVERKKTQGKSAREKTFGNIRRSIAMDAAAARRQLIA